MKSISRNDLKFFAGQALSGLSSNPFLMSMEGRRFLDMKKLTIEGLAVESALMMLERLSIVEASLDKTEELEREIEAKI